MYVSREALYRRNERVTFLKLQAGGRYAGSQRVIKLMQAAQF
jgi:hypothetical protein